MHLKNTLPDDAYTSLTIETAPCSSYTASASGHICVGDFMFMSAAMKSNDYVVYYCPSCFVMRQMLNPFCAVEMFGQITRIYDVVEEEKPHVEFDINVYMPRKKLPGSLGRFSSEGPEEQMLVQT
jgi:hypothetical protein